MAEIMPVVLIIFDGETEIVRYSRHQFSMDTSCDIVWEFFTDQVKGLDPSFVLKAVVDDPGNTRPGVLLETGYASRRDALG